MATTSNFDFWIAFFHRLFQAKEILLTVKWYYIWSARTYSLSFPTKFAAVIQVQGMPGCISWSLVWVLILLVYLLNRDCIPHPGTHVANLLLLPFQCVCVFVWYVQCASLLKWMQAFFYGNIYGCRLVTRTHSRCRLVAGTLSRQSYFARWSMGDRATETWTIEQQEKWIIERRKKWERTGQNSLFCSGL